MDIIKAKQNGKVYVCDLCKSELGVLEIEQESSDPSFRFIGHICHDCMLEAGDETQVLTKLIIARLVDLYQIQGAMKILQDGE